MKKKTGFFLMAFLAIMALAIAPLAAATAPPLKANPLVPFEISIAPLTVPANQVDRVSVQAAGPIDPAMEELLLYATASNGSAVEVIEARSPRVLSLYRYQARHGQTSSNKTIGFW